jgi:hypothetical protein
MGSREERNSCYQGHQVEHQGRHVAVDQGQRKQQHHAANEHPADPRRLDHSSAAHIQRAFVQVPKPEDRRGDKDGHGLGALVTAIGIGLLEPAFQGSRRV